MVGEIHRGIAVVSAASRDEWRQWLHEHHATEASVWLVIYHKKAKEPSVYYEEAVEEALCFGWIDSIAHKRNDTSRYQFFAKRKAKSNWSNSNKERVQRLLEEGKMQPAGQAMVDLAKETGTWDALTDVQNNVIPGDLQSLLDANVRARDHFDAFPPSSKRIILEWISNAKRPETRQKRIEETVRLAEQNHKANHYRQ